MNETADVPATATQRHRKALRVGWLLAAFVVSAAAVAIAASYFITAKVLNKDFAAQIRHTTGFTTTIHGGAHFMLFPRPHIEIENIRFSDPKAALRIDTARFTGYLRLLPLLAGRIEVGHAILYRPRMEINLDDRAMTPNSALGRAADTKSASPKAATIDAAKLGVVDIVSGSARLERHATPHDFLIKDINVTVDWRSLDASAALTGQFSFRDMPAQVKLWIAQPVELLRGGQSAASLRLDSDPLQLQASGNISAAAQFQYKGSLLASAPSLRAVAQLMGFSFGKHGRFADFDLRCDANVTGDSAALTNLHLHLDGNEYEGTLAVQTDRQTPSLSGTLATNLLDVTPFLAGLPRPTSGVGHWNAEPLDLADLGVSNLDLRLSATQLRLNDIKIKDAAFSVLTRPGLVDLALAEATSNGGTVKGHLMLSAKDKTLALRASGTATAVDVKPMMHGHAVKHLLRGRLSGSMMLESTGDSVDELIRNLSGRAQLDVTDGRVIGVDLAAALRDKAHHPLAAADDPSGKVTNFDRVSFGLQIVKGIAGITNGSVQGNGLAVSFGGTAGLGDRKLDLWALAEPTTATAEPGATGTPGAMGTPLRLGVKGFWDDLHIVTDRQPPANLPVSPPVHPAGTTTSQ